MDIETATHEEGKALAELRALAMRESLEVIGRFDPIRARERFLSKFQPNNTNVVRINNVIVAFYVVLDKASYLYIDHLYVHPEHQGKQIGSFIVNQIIEQARTLNKGVKVGALKGSRSNDFYQAHGFVKTHEEEFDIYYKLK